MLSSRLLPLLTLFLLLFIFEANGCNIQAKVRSKTKIPFRILIAIPSIGSRTEKTTFNAEGQEKKVVIKGENCNGKQWEFRTYKIGHTGKWIPAQHHTGKFDGNGEMIIEVGDALAPHVVGRTGVACAESLICG